MLDTTEGCTVLLVQGRHAHAEPSGRHRVRHHNIFVVGIRPGAVCTPISTSTMSDLEKLKLIDAAIPVGRMVQPEVIVSVVTFLAADSTSYVNATTESANGGLMPFQLPAVRPALMKGSPVPGNSDVIIGIACPETGVPSLASPRQRLLLLERGDSPGELDDRKPDDVFVEKYLSTDTWYDPAGPAFQPHVAMGTAIRPGEHLVGRLP